MIIFPVVVSSSVPVLSSSVIDENSIIIIKIVIDCIILCKCHVEHCSNFDCENIKYRIDIINYSKS